VTDDQFERLTNYLASINKALGSVYFVLVLIALLLAGILGNGASQRVGGPGGVELPPETNLRKIGRPPLGPKI